LASSSLWEGWLVRDWISTWFCGAVVTLCRVALTRDRAGAGAAGTTWDEVALTEEAAG